jgi:hypothetical protein
METQASLISRNVIDRELLQLSATSKKLTSSSDKTEGEQSQKLHHSLEWVPCSPGDDGDFEISDKFCVPYLLTSTEQHKTVENCSSILLFHPPYSPDLAP